MELFILLIIPIMYLLYTFLVAVRKDSKLIEDLKEEISSLKSENERLYRAIEPQWREEAERERREHKKCVGWR
jgi:hypothetical protein